MNARDVLNVLRASVEPMSIAEIAARLGVHLNTVRFHLNALARTGRVEQVSTAPVGPGRPALKFRAIRRMDPTGHRDYRLLAEILIDGLAREPDPAAGATEAGNRWGQRLGGAPDEATTGRPIPSRVATRQAGAGQTTLDRAAAGQTGAGQTTLDRATADQLTADQLTADQATDWLLGLLGELGFDPDLQGRQIGLRDCPFLEIADRAGEVVCAVHLGLMQGALSARRAPITVRRLEPFAEPDLCLAHLATAAGA